MGSVGVTDTALNVRPAIEQDLEAVFEMVRLLADYEKLEVVTTPDQFRESLFGVRPYAHALLAELGKEPVGMAIYFFNFSTFEGRPGLYLEDLFVRESFRRKGYGEIMLSRLAKIAVQSQCARFEWTVLDWNQSAIRFYEKMGATVLKEWRICRVSGKPLNDLSENRGNISSPFVDDNN